MKTPGRYFLASALTGAPALAAVLMFAGALAPAAAAEDARVTELEGKVEALTRQVEQLESGAAGDTSGAEARRGLGPPAAAREHEVGHGFSIGGYGEMLYENFDRKREDDSPSGQLDRVDYLRQVFYLGFEFDDQLRFHAGVGLEHTGVQDQGTIEGKADPASGEVTGNAALSGEVALEYAYLEWSRRPSLGIRAGMLLLPLGITNESHEPPMFAGARRPEVEQFIIPTTWRANGVGMAGDLSGGVSYRLYLTEGLNAARFGAAGIRDGRQGGSRSLATQPAVSVRLDYSRYGLRLGGSVLTGNTWQEYQPGPSDLAPRLTLFDLHGQLRWRGLDGRALYARGTLSDAGALSDALGLAGDARIGKSFFGAYGEAAYDVLPLVWPGTRYSLAPYARWETYDTQEDVPGGGEDPALERTVVTAGAAFRPHPNVVLKADRQWRSNRADTETGQWNLALGYQF